MHPAWLPSMPPSTTSDPAFDEILSACDSQGLPQAMESLAGRLRSEGRSHELFDLRLMQARHRAGLPVVAVRSLDELPEALRLRVEEAYLEACREVGQLLLDRGRVRDAWMYLRPVGDRAAMSAALAVVPADDHYEEIIEIALHEGVDPELGFRLVLKHYGTCNAITMFESEMANRPRAQRQPIASLLIEHLHQELSASVRSDIERQQGSAPPPGTLGELVARREWLFAEDNYHVDTTHLNAVVRFAHIVDDPPSLRLALDLTEYGRRLSPAYQFPGEEPFVEMYVASAMFFSALLGTEVDAALSYFRRRALECPVAEAGPLAAEVYISLLARLGRPAAAMDAYAELLPQGTRTTGFGPSLVDLASQGGDFQRLADICRQRGDLVGFVAGLVQQRSNLATGTDNGPRA
ncbi:MAG TPA: hypothetical protein VHY20_08935 [Pirellulales bacterium]|nr:hypothetical protein [Pirellulales bacterium]